MTPLNQKLFRGLIRLRGQVVAVALIVASGVGVMVMSLSALHALEETADAYYERYRFADVFGSARRAPMHLVDRIASIPGVRTVDTRIREMANLAVTGFSQPIVGELVSIPESGEPLLNRLALQSGQFVRPNRPDDVVLNEPFATAHQLIPGDTLSAIINGHRRTLHVVGTALSPEFVYALGPGAMTPDDKLFGVLWMGRDALAAAYDFDGAFNAVSLALLPNTEPQSVMTHLDNILDRYGSDGSVERARQLSNWFLMNEFDQLRSFSTVLPSIFLLVAAFLTNMVLARLIAIERSEIGLLKSFGYSNLQISWHYAKLVIAMSMVGIVLGWFVGAWLGQFNTRTYAALFHFPLLIYRPEPSVFALSGIISLIAALSGSLGAVLKAVRLAPAEAMRPPSPPDYRRNLLSRLPLIHRLDQSTRIILRQLVREPVRAALTSLGIAFSVGIMVLALQWLDSIEYMIEGFFFDTQRQNVMIGLTQAEPLQVINEFRHVPGVLSAEPLRTVGADFSVGNRSHRGSIQALTRNAALQGIHDTERRRVNPPAEGIILGTELASKLNIVIGDHVTVDIKEGNRPQVQLVVVDLVDTWFDLPAFMELGALSRVLRESTRTQHINLLVDPANFDAFYAAVKRMPNVSAVVLTQAAIQNFRNTMAETITIFVGFFGMFAAALGFGVVYNSARISLSERGRELASLRVLGFTRADISYILLGELALLILVALPIGCLLGWSLAWFLVTTSFQNELYRLPLVIYPSSYGAAILVCMSAAVFSAILVRRRLDTLDLIAVLKTRE